MTVLEPFHSIRPALIVAFKLKAEFLHVNSLCGECFTFSPIPDRQSSRFIEDPAIPGEFEHGVRSHLNGALNVPVQADHVLAGTRPGGPIRYGADATGA